MRQSSKGTIPSLVRQQFDRVLTLPPIPRGLSPIPFFCGEPANPAAEKARPPLLRAGLEALETCAGDVVAVSCRCNCRIS